MFNSKKIKELEEQILNLRKNVQLLCKHDSFMPFELNIPPNIVGFYAFPRYIS